MGEKRLSSTARRAGALWLISYPLLCGACVLPKAKVGQDQEVGGNGAELAVSQSGGTSSAAGAQAAVGGGPGGESASGGAKPVAPKAGSGGRSTTSAGAGAGGPAGQLGGSGGDVAGRAAEALARTWSTPAPLGFKEPLSNLQHQLDGQGRAISLWEANDDSKALHAWASRYLDGKWTDPVQVAAELGNVFGNSTLKADPAGHAVVLLLHKTPSTAPLDPMTVGGFFALASSEVYVSTLAPDGSWSAGKQLDSSFFGLRDLVLNRNGVALAASLRVEPDQSNPGWGVWFSRYAPDTGWTAASNIASAKASTGASAAVLEAAKDFPDRIAVGLNDAGRGLAVWGRKAGIYASEIGQAAGIRQLQQGSTSTSSSGTSEPSAWIAVGSDNSDRSIAMWTQYDGKHANLFALRFIRGTGWDSAPTLLENNDMADVMRPRLFVDKQGNALAVWAQADGTTSAIWYNRYALGSGWSGPQRLEPQSVTSNAQDPWIAGDDAGNVLAVWLDAGSLRASRYVSDHGWEPAVRVSQDGATADGPGLSMSPTGIGLATWKDDKGNHWFSRFE